MTRITLSAILACVALSACSERPVTFSAVPAVQIRPRIFPAVYISQTVTGSVTIVGCDFTPASVAPISGTALCVISVRHDAHAAKEIPVWDEPK